MSIRHEMDSPVTCSVTLALARVMDALKSESHQFSSRPRSSKAGRLCGACAGGTGSPGLGLRDWASGAGHRG